MNRLCTVIALLLLLMTPPAHGSEAAEAAAAEAAVENETIQPARRPKMPKTITFESSIGDVRFPHRLHQKMGCQGCHHQIHAKNLVTPHEAYLTYSWVNCHDCHSEEAETSTGYYGCAKCHHSNLENIADETLNAKVVVHKSCWKCHLSGTGVEASERCSYCHVREERSMATAEPANGN